METERIEYIVEESFIRSVLPSTKFRERFPKERENEERKRENKRVDKFFFFFFFLSFGISTLEVQSQWVSDSVCIERCDESAKSHRDRLNMNLVKWRIVSINKTFQRKSDLSKWASIKQRISTWLLFSHHELARIWRNWKKKKSQGRIFFVWWSLERSFKSFH